MLSVLTPHGSIYNARAAALCSLLCYLCCAHATEVQIFILPASSAHHSLLCCLCCAEKPQLHISAKSQLQPITHYCAVCAVLTNQLHPFCTPPQLQPNTHHCFVCSLHTGAHQCSTTAAAAHHSFSCAACSLLTPHRCALALHHSSCSSLLIVVLSVLTPHRCASVPHQSSSSPSLWGSLHHCVWDSR